MSDIILRMASYKHKRSATSLALLAVAVTFIGQTRAWAQVMLPLVQAESTDYLSVKYPAVYGNFASVPSTVRVLYLYPLDRSPRNLLKNAIPA